MSTHAQFFFRRHNGESAESFIGERSLSAIFTVLLAVQLLSPHPVAAQTLANQATDPTVLKQIIIYGRHSVRSSTVPDATLAMFASQPYPDFGVPTGYLTPHGAQAEILLGSYFRSYLLAEGLLTGADAADAKRSYFRANSIQRSNITAASLAAGLMPGATVPVHSYPLGQIDPVFDPISANVATLDSQRAAQEVAGMFNGSALPSALSAELSLLRSALYNYPNGAQPVPATPAGLVDPTAAPSPLTASTGSVQTGYVIDVGGLAAAFYAIDPFVMQYADGMPLQNVAWGRLSLSDLSQETRIDTLLFAIETASPYLTQVQGSNAAAHILRSMEQAVNGRRVPGAFSASGTNLVGIVSSDIYVDALASLIHLHWQLPGYQQDFAAPGGALVFELRQVRSTGEYIVRVYYTAQTFDQLRNLTPLTTDQPPATMQLLIPNGDQPDTTLDVSFHKFKELMTEAINLYYVQDPAAEAPPGPLTGVPLK
ncbi:MAG: histidine-type phosphatase [Bryobacteraceae bacterium]